MTRRIDVLVVGSVNRDYVCRVDRLPAPGQTVLGAEASVGSGGKGGNQAVAASLLGAATTLVACVGEDGDARALVADLVRAGVDTSEVETVAVRTGMALILVDGAGENTIVVAPGANDRVTPQRVERSVRALLGPGGVLVVQAEIPPAAFEAAVLTAAEVGARAVVNLAPYRPVPVDVLALADPLVVNETEAGELLGREVHGAGPAAEAAAELARRARSAVVTVGAAGAVVATGDAVEHVRAAPVTAVDTTGAGDAFTGALAAALSTGRGLVDAVRVGVRAGSWAVARPGAQSSFPDAAALGATH